MKRVFTILATVAICALGMFVLVGCGSGASDEDQIREVIGTDPITGADLAEEFRADSEFMELADMIGLDVDVFSEGLANHFSIDIESIDIQGKTATATVKIMMPDFAAMYELLDAKITDYVNNNDTSGMSEDDLYKVMGSMLTNICDDPEFPTSTEDFTFGLTKSAKGWALDDPDALEDEMNKVFMNI